MATPPLFDRPRVRPSSPAPDVVPAKPKHLTASALRGRGWTDAAIRRFLGKADATAPNPAYRSAAPMKLYDEARVEAVEASGQWRAWQARSVERRRSALAAAERRRRETVAAVSEIPIRLPVLKRDELERRAVTHRNRRAAERAARRAEQGDWDDADLPATIEGAAPAILERWCVNYLRHRDTPYDAALEGLYGKVGKHEAARLLRRRVYAEIAKAYPWLEHECWRQRSMRGMGEGRP